MKLLVMFAQQFFAIESGEMTLRSEHFLRKIFAKIFLKKRSLQKNFFQSTPFARSAKQ
jgi:hypothetical protein